MAASISVCRAPPRPPPPRPPPRAAPRPAPSPAAAAAALWGPQPPPRCRRTHTAAGRRGGGRAPPRGWAWARGPCPPPPSCHALKHAQPTRLSVKRSGAAGAGPARWKPRRLGRVGRVAGRAFGPYRKESRGRRPRGPGAPPPRPARGARRGRGRGRGGGGGIEIFGIEREEDIGASARAARAAARGS